MYPEQPLAQPKPSKNYTKQIVAGVLVLIVIVSIGFSAFSYMTLNKKLTDQNATNQQLQKRLAVVEYQDKYTESQVDKTKQQAVFLSSGQTYFGQITEITRDTLKLEKIYYLNTGSVDKAGNPTTSGPDVQLVKLGKEIHGPEDTMLIERKNISFWENLASDGQVSKAIAEYSNNNGKTIE